MDVFLHIINKFLILLTQNDYQAMSCGFANAFGKLGLVTTAKSWFCKVGLCGGTPLDAPNFDRFFGHPSHCAQPNSPLQKLILDPLPADG